MRKTINVNDLRLKVNKMLKDLPDKTDRHGPNNTERDGLITLIESVLHDTGNYSGFSYLTAHDMESSLNGTTVGVREQREDGSWNFDDTDRTRVEYY